MNVVALRRVLGVSWIVLLVVFLPALTHGAPPLPSVEVDTADVALADPVVDAVSRSLAQRPPELIPGTRFRIIGAAAQPGWALVSVVALDAPDLDPHAPDAGGLSTLVLAQQSPDGTWQIAIDGEDAFAHMLASAPSALLAADAKAILGSDPAAQTAAAVDYKFPWPAGQSWGWWQGWHTSAHDLGTTSTDRRVLAAADGVVSAVYSCTLSTIIDLKHADGAVFRYIHIDKQSVDTAAMRVGAYVPQGLVLGTARPNSFSDGNCGYTTQSPGWAHNHWVMPTDRPMTIDGWTIQYPTSAWRKDGTTKVPGYGTASTLPSTNMPRSVPQPGAPNLHQRVFLPMAP